MSRMNLNVRQCFNKGILVCILSEVKWYCNFFGIKYKHLLYFKLMQPTDKKKIHIHNWKVWSTDEIKHLYWLSMECSTVSLWKVTTYLDTFTPALDLVFAHLQWFNFSPCQSDVQVYYRGCHYTVISPLGVVRGRWNVDVQPSGKLIFKAEAAPNLV